MCVREAGRRVGVHVHVGMLAILGYVITNYSFNKELMQSACRKHYSSETAVNGMCISIDATNSGFPVLLFLLSSDAISVSILLGRLGQRVCVLRCCDLMAAIIHQLT